MPLDIDKLVQLILVMKLVEKIGGEGGVSTGVPGELGDLIESLAKLVENQTEILSRIEAGIEEAADAVERVAHLFDNAVIEYVRVKKVERVQVPANIGVVADLAVLDSRIAVESTATTASVVTIEAVSEVEPLTVSAEIVQAG